MSTIVKSSGHYTAPNKEEVQYDFSFQQFDSIEDALTTLGDDKALKNLQRMEKVDANNTAREKAKVANGHSTAKVMTEEEKAEAKAQRAADKALLAMIKSKGLSAEDISSL